MVQIELGALLAPAMSVHGRIETLAMVGESRDRAASDFAYISSRSNWASSRLRSSSSDEDDNDVKGEVDREVSSPRCRSTVALTGNVSSQERSVFEPGAPKPYLKAEVSASCGLWRE